MRLCMDAVHAARCAGHGPSSKKRNKIGAAKVGALAAATCMLLTAIQFPAADRRTGLQTGNILETYDATAHATSKPEMSARTQTESTTPANTTPNRTMISGCIAAIALQPQKAAANMAQAEAPYTTKSSDAAGRGGESSRTTAGPVGEQPWLVAQPAPKAAARKLQQPAGWHNLWNRHTFLVVAVRQGMPTLGGLGRPAPPDDSQLHPHSPPPSPSLSTTNTTQHHRHPSLTHILKTHPHSNSNPLHLTAQHPLSPHNPAKQPNCTTPLHNPTLQPECTIPLHNPTTQPY